MELDLYSLRAYLATAFVPGARTLWRDVREVGPGMAVTFPGATESTVWRPSEPQWDSDAPLEEHAAGLRPRLEEAVRVRLPAEGAVAVALSGGLDSSLVTAIAARQAPGRVHTFSLHFGPEHRNELEFSDLVARHCETEHYVLTFRGTTIRDALPETLALLDDPIGDPLTVPNLLMARAAAGVSSVLLNGEGGDPCFGGPKNAPMLLDTLYGTAGDRAASYLRSYQKCYDDLPALLTRECREALRGEEPLEDLFATYLADPSTKDYLDRLMLLNLRFKGADHILTKVNNLTSACCVSGRSPLFDERVIDAAFAIPAQYKLAGADEKRVLKASVADLLPAAILERPKSGMLVPVQSWFKGDFRRYAEAHLLSRRSRIRPMIDQRRIREWLNYRGNLWPRHGVKLWLLLTLEIWLREAGV
jgi:asparagine synthase (glutamine-hydrolysing)